MNPSASHLFGFSLSLLLGAGGAWTWKHQSRSNNGTKRSSGSQAAEISSQPTRLEFNQLDNVAQLRLLAKWRSGAAGGIALKDEPETILQQAMQQLSLQHLSQKELLNLAFDEIRGNGGLRAKALGMAMENDPTGAAAFFSDLPKPKWETSGLSAATDAWPELLKRNRPAAMAFIEAMLARTDCLRPQVWLALLAQDNFLEAYARMKNGPVQAFGESDFWNTFALNDIKGAVQAMQQVKGDMGQIFGSWANDDLPAALNWMRTQSKAVQLDCAGDVVNAMAQSDPAQVLPFLLEYPELKEPYPLTEYVGTIYQQGFPALLEAVGSVDSDSLKFSALSTILQNHSAQSGQDFATLVQTIFPNGPTREDEAKLARALDYFSVNGNPATIWAKYRALPAGLPAGIAGNVFSSLASTDPVQAITYWQELPEGEARDVALNSVLWHWAQTPDDAGAKFVAQLPAKDQPAAVASWVEARILHDADGVFTWLEQTPLASGVFEQNDQMIDQLLEANPSKTLNALHRLTAEQLVAVAENIWDTNREAALKSLPQSTLNAEQRAIVLETLKQ